MSVRFHFTLLNTAIVAGVLGLFVGAVYLVSRGMLLIEIDKSLEETAVQVREEMRVVAPDGLPVELIPPENLAIFETRVTSVLILDIEGRVVAQSGNRMDGAIAEDRDGRYSEAHYSTIVHDDEHFLRILTTPLFLEDDSLLVGYVQVTRRLDSYMALLSRLRLVLLLTGVGAICLSLFLGAFLAHRLLKPLDDIAAVALRITRADDLSQRLPDLGRNDEIGRLTFVLNQTLERLERLFQSQQRFLADVSHELRTPLTTIRGNVDLMRRMNMAEPETLSVIQEEVARMTRLVDDLMLLARADAGGLPIQRQEVELDNIFLDIYRQVSALDPPVDLTLKEIDQVCVWGDGDRLKQLMLNLVDNAIKYTLPGGKVMLSLSQQDGTVYITVADTGVGIPEEDTPLIFERFYRVEKSRARIQGGSGLGLSIAKWIAEAHGGRIAVTSKVGEGTTFVVSLPVLPQEKRSHNTSSVTTTRPRLRVLRSNRP